MAVEYDKNDLQTQFEGIRDERRLQANTAYRIGTAFLSLLHFASDEMHTTIEELLKKIEGKYLSKVKDDEAAGLITFLRGLRVGAGYKFDESGNILADSIDANNLNIGRGYKFDENGDIISRDIEAHDINANDLSVGGNSVFAGDLSSPDFVAGFLTGKGWRLKNEPIENAAGVLENKYNLELDNLIVRGSMRIFEMIISQLLGENDNRIFTAMMEVDHFDAESGRVYLDTKEGRMYNSFRKGDYIMVQQYNGLPSEENDHYVTKNYELLVKEVGTEGEGEDRLAWVTFENFTSSMAGATPEKLITKRDTFVRVDNVSDTDRKGIIQVMTVGSDTPYIDIVHGMKTNPDSALKGRIGNLKGIRHPILGQLKGFGEYLNNLYAVGEFVLSRTGESIDTKFQVLENMFSSRFSKTSYELTNEKNYLENGQFLEQITDSENKIIAGWDIDTTDESVFWFDASGLPVMVNGNPTASGNRKVSLEKVDGRQILRVQNCGIRQKNALIKQPGTHKEYVAGEKSSAELPPTEAGYTDVQDKLYISVRIYAKTAGKLTIGFADCEEVRGKQNTLQQRTVNVAYSGAWKTIPIEGVWNGTGDFVIQYTGDCYLAIASLTDEPLSELSKTVSTQIVQTANNIKLLGENIDTVNKKAVKVGIELDAEKGEIRQYVDQTDKKNREDTSSLIVQTSSSITSSMDKKLKDQYDTVTSEYSSSIRQTAEGIRQWVGSQDYANNTTVSSSIELLSGSISALAAKVSFDSSGNITNINKTGLVLTSTFAGLFTSQVSAKGLVSEGQMNVAISNGISAATIQADKINLTGHCMNFSGGQITITTPNFKLDSTGSFWCQNGTFSGTVTGVHGSFKTLDCVDSNGNVVGNIQFGSDGRMWFSGDMYHQGYDSAQKRGYRFYAADVWCRGMFGHRQKTMAWVFGTHMRIYTKDADNTEDTGVYIALESGMVSGRRYYKIPLYGFASFGDASGMAIDMVVINCSSDFYYVFEGMGNGKEWRVINGNDKQTIHFADIGGWHELKGGESLSCAYVNPKFLNPKPTSLGAGVFWSGEYDLNWS